MTIRFRNILPFVPLFISALLTYFLYLTHAPYPIKGEFGLGITSSLCIASVTLSIIIKDILVKITFAIAAFSFVLCLLLLFLTYFLTYFIPWIKLPLEYYIQSLFLLGLFEFTIAVIALAVKFFKKLNFQHLL